MRKIKCKICGWKGLRVQCGVRDNEDLICPRCSEKIDSFTVADYKERLVQQALGNQIHKPLEKPILIATRGRDKMWKVGYNEEHELMIQLEIDGELQEPKAMGMALKWLLIDPREWKEVDKWE